MPILMKKRKEREKREYGSVWFALCSYYFVTNFKMDCKHLFNLIAPIAF